LRLWLSEEPRGSELIGIKGSILIFSTVVTVGLIALYVYGKTSPRW
jgi:hypothetical protein